MTAKRKNRNARFGRSGGTQPVRSIVTIPTPGEPDTSKVRGLYAGGDGLVKPLQPPANPAHHDCALGLPINQQGRTTEASIQRQGSRRKS